MRQMRRRNMPVIGVSRTLKPGLTRVETYGKDLNWHPLLDGVQTVVHLAARVHVMDDRAADPLKEFREANVETTLHLARAAVRAGVRRIVYVSSIKVHGEESLPGRPFKAEDITKPADPYAASKAEAEQLLMKLGHSTGLEVVIIRPPLVYGPGSKGNLATIARWSKLGLPSPFGALQNRRSLIHVENLCSALIAACTLPSAANQILLVADSTTASTHEIFLASGWRRSTRILDIAFRFTLLALLRHKESLRRRLLGNLEVDISKTKSLLDWEPSPFGLDNRKDSLRR